MDYSRSQAMFQRARQVLAGGISSNVRAADRPFPLFFDRGKGSHIWDVDGNEYVDFVMARGPLILGHSHPQVLEAVERTLRRAQMFAAQSELECEVAELVRKHFPSMEMVRFANTGSEAIHAVLRLARAATGRSRIVKFEGHYHGWLDNIVYGIPSKVKQGDLAHREPSAATTGRTPAEAPGDLLVLEWNDLSELEAAFQTYGEEIAAVIMEPVMCNSGCLLPKAGYLEAVRQLCTRHGALLIFDEVVTGFRVGLTGAQGRYGVAPDLTVLGKALAGGFVLSCFGGRRELMEMIADQRVLHAGTYNANPVSLAAAKTVIRILEEQDFPRLCNLGNRLREGLVELSSKFSLPCGSDGLGSIFCFYLTTAAVSDPMERLKHRDDQATALLQESLLEHGVRVTPEGTWCLSFAHDESDLELALGGASKALAGLSVMARETHSPS